MQWRMAGVARTKRTSGCVATAFFGRARIYRGVTRSALAIAQPARVCSRLLRPMNLPNILTISRVPLMFIIVALMFIDLPWAATTAFWLFIVAALTDWLDGKLARERGEVSAFGRFMDAVIDKVLVIGLMIALVGNPENF